MKPSAKHARTASFSLAILTALAASPVVAAELAGAGVLECPAPGGGTQRIELDEGLPIAVIDDEERPALYNTSHVLIRLDPEGRTLTIGRVTGRILASTPGREPTLLGQCTAPIRA